MENLLVVHRPSIEVTEAADKGLPDRFAQVRIQPLEPGFGYTLGNSLRRALLSSIPGAAATTIRIEGIQHEFTTIPGVKEDVTELILNVKDLVFRSESDEPVAVRLTVAGPADITGADLQIPAGVEIINPDQHICTVNKRGQVEIELMVERGRGYVTAEGNKDSSAPIGVIPIDSLFSPVRRVTYSVESTRVEQRTDFDRLILDIETDGSITPNDALSAAGGTLVELFQLFAELGEGPGLQVGPEPGTTGLEADLAKPIEEMDFSVRSYNCLKREGVSTVGELLELTEDDLLDIRNFGQKSIEEVKQKVAEMGMSLKKKEW